MGGELHLDKILDVAREFGAWGEARPQHDPGFYRLGTNRIGNATTAESATAGCFNKVSSISDGPMR
jgi:hypothetical protein